MNNTADHEQNMDAVQTADKKNQWVAPALILLNSADTFGKSLVNPAEASMTAPS